MIPTTMAGTRRKLRGGSGRSASTYVPYATPFVPWCGGLTPHLLPFLHQFGHRHTIAANTAAPASALPHTARYHYFYGSKLRIEVPTGSGNMMDLREAAVEICRRLSLLFKIVSYCFTNVHSSRRAHQIIMSWRLHCV